MTLILVTIAWTVGMMVTRQLDLPPHLLGGLAVAGLVVSWRRKNERLVAALALATIHGGWRYTVTRPVTDEGCLWYYNDGGSTSVRGLISAEPSIRDRYTQLEISALEIEQGDQWRPVHGKMVLKVAHYPEFKYGDALLVTGVLETPPVSDDFSYKEYLASHGVHSLIRQAQATELPQQPRGSFVRWVYDQKKALRGVIESILPNPDAGLLSGILLGLSHTLPDYLAEAFRGAGLTHIIVISGFNISLVSQSVMLVTRRSLHRWLVLLISLFAIALYAFFVGLSAPVLRAALMGCLFILGQLAGRRSHPLTSLATASLIMTAWNPLTLWSVSFQLSFASTLALILIEPVLTRHAYSWMITVGGANRASAWIQGLRDVLLATVAAQMTTLPIICYYFSRVSIISLLTNVLVLPVQPVIMILGGIATGLGRLWLPAGRIAAWLVWPLLRYTIVIIQGLGDLPLASISVPSIGPGVVWAFYALLCIAFHPFHHGKLRLSVRDLRTQPLSIKLGIPALSLVAVLAWAAVFSLPDGKLHIYFLDIGQGDAILLRTPGGRTILVDGGPDPLLLTSRLGQVLPFWQRRIDLVVATHADQDHIAGLVPVIEHYEVGHAMESPVMGGGALSTRWRQVLTSTGTDLILCHRGMEVRLGQGLAIRFLHPSTGASSTADTDDNRNSVVIQVIAGRCHVLLTADIDAVAEQELLAAGEPLKATLLKVAHHGSRFSSSVPFLRAVDPQLAVISVGEDNTFGHPSRGALERLEAIDCKVLRTDLQGTVELITDGQTCWVKCAKGWR